MSWFTTLFSPTSAPAPTSTPAPHLEKQVLEEPEALAKSAQTFRQSSTTQTQPASLDRPNRNRVVFGAGIAFFAFSLLLTRRAFARRRIASNPAFYTNAPGHSAEQAAKVSGPIEAVDALSIATVNVLSLAMMGTGGAMWYLNINSMADARRVLRGGLGVDGSGKTEQEAEEEFEEWLAVTLARKDAKAVRPTSPDERRGS